MSSFNKVILLGNLTRDPELRYLQNGTAVCDLGLAVNRKWKRDDGESVEEVLFIDIVVWGKQGENVNEYLKKGAGVLVEGHLRLETWDGQDGSKRSKHKVVADRVVFMPKGGGGAAGEADARGSSSAERTKRAAYANDPSVPF